MVTALSFDGRGNWCRSWCHFWVQFDASQSLSVSVADTLSLRQTSEPLVWLRFLGRQESPSQAGRRRFDPGRPLSWKRRVLATFRGRARV